MDDPVSEAACYLALVRHGQTHLLLVQGPVAKPAGPVAVIWRRLRGTTVLEPSQPRGSAAGGAPR